MDMLRSSRTPGSIIAWSLALLAVLCQPIQACLWDTETLREERARSPSTLETIIGKFPRHTLAYYEWRLKDRLATIERDGASDQLLDDVAVSYEKLGRYDDAIQVATEQLQRNPQRYESLANLGTFLIHSGRYREGLQHIEQAIEVNPDAHFGRERYQIILVKYVLERSDDDALALPMAQERFEGRDGPFHWPFYQFLWRHLQEHPDDQVSAEQIEEAKRGILGMMRFSRHDSPILLEALGELLESQDARQLAYRAYMSASFNVEDKQAKAGYAKLASHALEYSRYSWKERNGVDVSEQEIADDFQEELTDAETWYAQLADDERRWIGSGANVDVAFDEKYRSTPAVAITTDPETERYSASNYAYSHAPVYQAVFVCMVLVALIVGALLWLVNRRLVSRGPAHAKPGEL